MTEEKEEPCPVCEGEGFVLINDPRKPGKPEVKKCPRDCKRKKEK